MAEKKIQARIRQKVDTKANWDKATNFVPLKGEYIYYSDLHKVKVGDGVTKVGALPFLADSDTHQPIKTLNTNNTAPQTPSSNEAIAGSGTINLHKVAKTGSYNDLNNKPNIVKYTEATVEVAGTKKTVAAVSPSALYVANGLIMGGTAAAAGLVTRGICGVTTPDSTTGACTKENLYLNYDGDNNYSRKVVLGAGSPGNSIAGGATTLSAVRGDQMVGYVNSLALIKSGKQTTTSTADGGSNVYTFTDTKGATSTFTVKNGSKGSNGHDGTAAGFGTPTASVDANVGTPSVTITSSGPDTAKVFNFAFKNLKGETGGQGPEGPRGPQGPAGGTGPQGPGGAAAGFGSVTATIDAGVGTPSVTVSTSGDNTKKNFAFAFKNLKGATGAHISSVTGDKTPAAGNTVTYTMKNTDGTTAGTFKVVNGTNGGNGHNGAAAGFGTPTASITNTTGTPTVTVTASGPDTAKVFDFKFTNLKGATGATGSVASITYSGSGNYVKDISLNTSTKVLTATKGTLAAVATSGSYNDLINKPTIPNISNLVPYTGATKDVDLGKHSLSISNKSDGTGKITISSQGISEDDVYCEITSTGVQLMDPGAGTGYNVNYIDVNGFKIYLPNATYIPSGAEVFAMKSNLSNLLDKGSASTNNNQVVYNPVEMKKALTVPSVTVSDIKNAAMVSTDANGKLTKSNLPATFAQISVIDKSIQYNDNIEVTEVYLNCESMEDHYKWDRLVFSAPGSPAASNIKYYYNNMGQKTELTPTNASALNDAIGHYGESLAVAINRNESNPTITYLPNDLVFGGGYYSDKEGNGIFTYYVYDSPEGYTPALREIVPDTSTQQWKLTSTSGAVTTVNICTK